MNFGMIMLNQSIKIIQNYSIWILTVLLFIYKTKDFHKDIADDVEKWFETSNYDDDLDRPLSKGRNKKKIVFFKDELGGMTMKEFVGFRANTYAYLMDYDSEKKNTKGTKKCVIKRILKLNDYKDFLFNNKMILK